MKETKERNLKPLKVSKKSIPRCLIIHFFEKKSKLQSTVMYTNKMF